MILFILLVVIVIYSLGSWLYLAHRSLHYEEDWEEPTFHLGLCATIALAALYIGDKL